MIYRTESPMTTDTEWLHELLETFGVFNALNRKSYFVNEIIPY